ncbi:MAG: hypothetical protein ACHQ2E_12105 [Gemmatimonadales bacterium]
MPQSARADKAPADKPPHGHVAVLRRNCSRVSSRIGGSASAAARAASLVVAPRGQEQADVVQVGMGRHVLERLCAKARAGTSAGHD